MSTARVLIVGAGALGLTTGYHLHKAGAEISFLVRPHRVQALSRPQRLYSYGDHDLKILESHALFTAAADLRGQQFDFVLLTLDGATCRSEQGVATLTALGRALADTGTSLVMSGVGIGLYEHVRTTTGFDRAKLLEGTMRMFAYQVNSAGTPLPRAEDLETHNGADIAYLNFPDRVGFFVASTPKQVSRAFVALYNQCRVATCKRMPRSAYAMGTNMFFAFTLASELNGWKGTDALIAERELWHLCCSSQREIMGLSCHGLVGKLASRLLSDARLENMMRKSDREASAMGFTAFNRFHHGGKVLAQDVQVLENCIARGVEEGRSMRATQSLLQRWRENHG